MSTRKKVKDDRGRWEATLRNIRVLKRRSAKLEQQIHLLWKTMEGMKLDISGTFDKVVRLEKRRR